MPTTVRTLNYVSPDAAALSPITLPDATEMALYANANIKNWWRADAGVDSVNKKWRCRKTDAALIPSKTVFPTQKSILGTVPSIAVADGGIGYTAATVSLAAPPAGGRQATATATVSGGAVTAIVVVDHGEGYLSAPAVTVLGDGSGATATATLDANGPYNGREAMVFANGVAANGALYDGGLNLLPINANFSVIVVARQGPSPDKGWIWGNGIAPTSAGGAGVIFGSGTSFNSTVVTVGGTNLVNQLDSPTAPITFIGGPAIHITSFNDAENSCAQLISPGGFVQNNSSMSGSLHVTNGEFHLGDAGPIATSLPEGSYIQGGDIAEVFILDLGLSLAANATLLSSIRTYLGARYGLTVP